MNIKEHIEFQNPWFREPNFVPFERNLPKRHTFAKLLDEVKTLRQITSITGLRRVGKSTLLKQLISSLLLSGTSHRSIFYFSFDQPTVVEHYKTLEEVLEWYATHILRTGIPTLRHTVYLFLDEIQLIPYWQDILKRYYDANQHVKFIITGSASLFLRQKSKESLAGRIFHTLLPPLSFTEYKNLSKKDDWEEFLDFGQFPEMLSYENRERKIEYMQEGIIGKVLDVDIDKLYGVRKTVDFARLFWSLLPNTGHIIQSGNLMSDLSLKKTTLFRYFSILESTLLVQKVLNLSGSFRSEKRLLRKVYPASSNFFMLAPSPINIGVKVETYVNTILQTLRTPVFLYNQRGKEIDFVLPQKQIAIEVKYQDHIRPQDYTFLDSYIKEKKYKGIVISKTNQSELPEKNIRFIPLESFEKEVTSF